MASPTVSTTQLANTVAAQGQQLDSLTGDMHAMRKQFTEFSTTMLGAIGDLKSAMRTHEATRPAGIFEMVPAIRDIALLLTLATSGIVYVVGATFGAQNAVAERTIAALTRDLDRRQADEHKELTDYRRFLRQPSLNSRSVQAQ